MADYDATDPDGGYQYQGTGEPPQSIDINATDSQEGWDPLYQNRVSGFENPNDMVDNVLDEAGDQKIHTLQIIDHGGPGYQEMGEFEQSASQRELNLDPDAEADYRANMHRLYGHFTDDGSINMGGCNVGQGPLGTEFLSKRAVDSGVPVSGAINEQSGKSLSTNRPYYEDEATRKAGPYKTCNPAPTDEEVQCYVTDPTTGMTYAPGEGPDA